MIYDQLVRVNQIDDEIDLLHQQLGQLYKERKAIVSPPVAEKPAKSHRLNWKRRAPVAKKGTQRA
jgi:hypothetical protein